jgi:cell cycle arrest protein BUB2
MKTDELVLIRILNAISFDHGYVQGMNVLLAPFTYFMSEIDSYYCFKALVTHHCPSYILKNLDGVHKGVKLFNECLKLLDVELYNHLTDKLLDSTVYSFRYLMTLLANIKPLAQVLVLWDAIFAFGIHFNIILFSAYLILNREKLLNESNPYK